MKKFMIFFSVFVMLFLVSCSGSSKDDDKTDTGDTMVDTGDTDPADPTDTATDTDIDDTDPTEPTEPLTDTDTDDTDMTEPTDPTDPTDPTEPEEGGTWEDKYKRADKHAEKVSKDVIKANNGLGMKMFSKLAAEEIGQNMMISPLSISIAMAMTANGTEKESLAEMKKVLGFGEMELPTVNKQFKELIASLVAVDKDLVLEIADSIWIDDRFSDEVKEEFISVLEESYDTELFKADFGDDATVGLINSWVSEKTHDKIDKIIDEISPDTVMHLINAIYFKAAWSIAFNKDATHTGEFVLADGTKTEADYMSFMYNDDPEGITYGNYVISGQNVAGVKVPYGRGAFAFYAYVANPDYGTPNGEVLPLDEIIGKIAGKGVENYLPSATYDNYIIRLPKFKFEYQKSLRDVFESLGLEKIFGAGGMSAAAPSLYVSEIIHKTYIDVNEDGTEAAAVTDIDVGDTGEYEGPNRFLGFYGRRPFFFFIRDERNGSILFIGKVENPAYE